MSLREVFVLALLLQACARFKRPGGPSYEPKITFLSVQKRHGTRLYPGEAKVRALKLHLCYEILVQTKARDMCGDLAAAVLCSWLSWWV